MLTHEHIVRASAWDLDLYAGKVAVWWQKSWRWAYLDEQTCAVAPHAWPNGVKRFFRRGEDLQGLGIGLDCAVALGWVTIGDELDGESKRLVMRRRFGRVGRVEGRVIADPPVDFDDDDDISPPGWNEAWRAAWLAPTSSEA
jgi:hypothetical protein